MGIFDFRKKKKADKEPSLSPEVQAKDEDLAKEPASPVPGENGEGDSDIREEEGSSFVPGDAVTLPEEEDIPDVGGEALAQIRVLCADRAARVRIRPHHVEMLESLKEVYPILSMFPPERPLRADMNDEEGNRALAETIAGAAKSLGMVRYRQAVQHFNDVETDTLKDAWVLLDYYAAATRDSDPAPFIRARKMLDRTLWGRIQKEDLPLLEQRRAVGKLRDGVEYILQMQEEDWAYMAEIHDRVGIIPGMKAPEKGKMNFVAFNITREEYAWKEDADENGVRPRVNELLNALIKKLPQDRLLVSGVIDPSQPGKVQPAPVKPLCPTMDDRRFIRWRSALAAERVKACDTVYVLTSRATGSRFPLVDANYAGWVFSRAEYADGAVRGNPGFDLRARAMNQAEFSAYLSTWAPMGVHSFRWNPGTRDHTCEVLTDDCLGQKSAPLGYEGGALNRLILRWRQNRRAAGDPAAEAMADTAWNLIAHVLPGTLFLVPFNYKEDVFFEDSTLHVTAPSANLVNLRSLERSLGRRLRPGEKPEFKKVNGVPVLMYDRDMFYGGREYTLSDPRQAGLGRPMLFSTVKNGDVTYMCGFTDLESFRAVFKANKRVAVLTWDELKHHVGGKNSDGSISSGLVINPGYAELILDSAMIEDLEKARREPVKIFMPAPKKPSGAPEPPAKA